MCWRAPESAKLETSLKSPCVPGRGGCWCWLHLGCSHLAQQRIRMRRQGLDKGVALLPLPALPCEIWGKVVRFLVSGWEKFGARATRCCFGGPLILFGGVNAKSPSGYISAFSAHSHLQDEGTTMMAKRVLKQPQSAATNKTGVT